MAQIYRKTALDKISSPEQLDKSLKITSPLSWLVLLGLTLIVVVVVIWSITGWIPETITAQGVLTKPEGVCSVFASESGTIVEVEVDVDEEVHIGTPVIKYKTGSKTENEPAYLSDQHGTVYKVLKQTGEVQKGEEILRVTPAVTNRELVAVCYVSKEDAVKIKNKLEGEEGIRGKEGEYLKARVSVNGISSQKNGYMEARVFCIDNPPPIDIESNTETKTAVVCEFFPNPKTKTGQRWTNEKGYSKVYGEGDQVSVQIVINEMHPIEKLFQWLGELWNHGSGSKK